MVTVIKGDLFESRAQTWVNTVNCVGVMGKGIARGFKERFPEMFKDYVRRCDSGSVKLGRPYLYRTLVPPWILNFPTKDHWRSVTKLSDIVAGLDYLEKHYQAWGIESLAVPPLGCGEGKLEWRVVGPTLYRHLARLDIDVELYAPFQAPDSELDPEFLARGAPLPDADAPVRVPAAAVALVAILRMVETEPFRWPVGRTIFQKLAYFATQTGIPTELDYRRSSYGPFADGLKQLQTRLVNNGLIEEHRLGRMFEVRTGPTYPDASERYGAQLDQWRPAMERVADLLLRTDTRQAEVLASVHFAAQNLLYRSQRPDGMLPSEQDIVDEVMLWKIRRMPPLEQAEVATAARTLNLLGWIHAVPSEGLGREPDFAELVG